MTSLFDATAYQTFGRRIAVDPDGERFLLLKTTAQTGAEDAASPRINAVLNWFEELKARVPVP